MIKGLDQSKITTFSVKRLAEEMWYVGEKMSKFKKGTKTIFIFDANWGIFEKDVDLSYEILKVMNKYDWPQYIECLTPKSNWNNLLKINDILKNRVQLSLSMQSLDLGTLKEIKRTNWTIKQYLDFVNEVKKRGKLTASEMIIPLPKETEKSYFDGVKFFMDNHVQTRTWSLMQLVGTELGRDHAIEKYGLKSKYRILPKEFGVYNDETVLEIEKICVGTNTMDLQGYLNCRNYSFILKLLSHGIFFPVNKLAKKLNISWFDFSKKFLMFWKKAKLVENLKSFTMIFVEESHEELFDSKDEAIEFYSKPDNYKSLLNGDIGENLGAKYQAKSLLILDSVFTTIFLCSKNYFEKNLNKTAYTVLNSTEKWLKNIYLIDAIIDENTNFQERTHNIKIEFDFPEWIKKNEEKFENFTRSSEYKLNYDLRKIQYIRNEIKTVQGDKLRALGRYLDRRHMIGLDLFEKKFEKVAFN